MNYCNNVLGGRSRRPYDQDEKVLCDAVCDNGAVCAEKMRYDNIKRHYKRKHPSNDDLQFHRVGEEQNLPKKQKKIGSFFPQSTTGRSNFPFFLACSH